MEATKKLGRPFKKEAEKRMYTFGIRLTEDERDLLKKEIELTGLTASQLVRLAICNTYKL
jgi:hypothetical protein